MVCKHCGGEFLQRVSRRGLLQKHLFPLFGFYPWFCPDCYKVRLYHVRHALRHDAPKAA